MDAWQKVVEIYCDFWNEDLNFLKVCLDNQILKYCNDDDQCCVYGTEQSSASHNLGRY